MPILPSALKSFPSPCFPLLTFPSLGNLQGYQIFMISWPKFVSWNWSFFEYAHLHEICNCPLKSTNTLSLILEGFWLIPVCFCIECLLFAVPVIDSEQFSKPSNHCKKTWELIAVQSISIPPNRLMISSDIVHRCVGHAVHATLRHH